MIHNAYSTLVNHYLLLLFPLTDDDLIIIFAQEGPLHWTHFSQQLKHSMSEPNMFEYIEVLHDVKLGNQAEATWGIWSNLDLLIVWR